MKHPFTQSAVCLAVLASLSSLSYASIVRGDVDYREFRDFAENRGKFEAGALDIPVYDKRGRFLGNVFGKGIPMPDFSSVEKNYHVNTLVHPQYTVSVRHNSDRRFMTSYGGLTFGTSHHTQNGVEPFKYQVLARNDSPNELRDFNTPRLHKMVTEVVPAEMEPNLNPNDFRNGRFSAFARVGTGTQFVLNDDNSLSKVSDAYIYPIGGTPPKLGRRGSHEDANGKSGTTYPYGFATALYKDSIYNLVMDTKKKSSPMVSHTRPGDSGSPLFAFDSKLKRWFVVGLTGAGVPVERGRDIGSTIFPLVEKEAVDALNLQNLGTSMLVKNSKPISWRALQNGVSTISSEKNSFNLAVAKGKDINNGEDLIIGSSNANLTTNLILANDINQGAGGLYFMTSAKVTGANPNVSWIGSGIYIADNEKVEWQIRNPKGDRISKLGQGELLVNGTGVNLGTISVGDGKVTLAQKADAEGRKQAFSEVQLASGRGVVSLSDAEQLKTTKVSFGHRGGKLDMNNNNLVLDTISHMDDGATITNLKNKYVLLKVTNDGVQHFKGNFGHEGRSHLSLQYTPKSGNGVLSVTGNVNLRGYVQATTNAKLVFTGAPIEHADLYSATNKITNDYDWKNREVNAGSSFYAWGNSTIDLGRNISNVQGAFKGNQNGTFHIGFINGVSLNCQNENCPATTLTQDVISGLPVTQVKGDLLLSNNAKAIIGKAHLYGGARTTDSSLVHLTKEAKWTLSKDSEINELRLDKGSKVFLNPDNEADKFNTLTINKKLSGEGYFRFSTNLAKLGHNKLILNGVAEGRHILSFVNSGAEPTLEKLSSGLFGIRLVEIKSANSPVEFTFESRHLDAGAYRYKINNDFTFARHRWKRNKAKEVVQNTNSEVATVSKVKEAYTPSPLAMDSRLNLSKKVEIAESLDDVTHINALRETGSQSEVMSDYANAGVYRTATAQRVASQGFDDFMQNGVSSEPKAAWFKIQKSKMNAKSSDYRSEKQNRKLSQFATTFGDSDTVLALGYTENSVSGEKRNNVKSFGAYAKHQLNNATFALIDTQYGRAKEQQHRQNVARLGLTLGANLTENRLGFTPYLGFALSRFSSVKYALDDANIWVKRQYLPTYHAGMKLDYRFDLAGLNVKPFVAAHYVASNKKQSIAVNNIHFNQKFDNRLSYQAGVDLNLNRFSVMVAASTIKGKELRREDLVDVKVGFTW